MIIVHKLRRGCVATVNTSEPDWTWLTENISFDARSGEFVSCASVTDYVPGETVTVTATAAKALAVASFI
jgi:hypothetical protein